MMIPLLIAMLAAGSVLFIWIGLMPRSSASMLVERVGEPMSYPMTIEEAELQQPFKERVLKPMVRSLIQAAARLSPQKNVENIRHQLLLAGNPYNMTVTDFLGVRTLAASLGALLGLGLILLNGQLTSRGLFNMLIMAALGFYVPTFWLKRRIKQRQEEVIKALPDAIDMLTISVDAGLGLDAAMQRIAAKWSNALAREFGRVVTEIQMGKPRRDALRDMANRLDVSDVSNFVAVLLQADQLGLSISRILHAQSAQLRMRRRQRAEEKARQAPLKMLFPLVFLIFPAMFVVILGPAVPLFIETFGGMR